MKNFWIYFLFATFCLIGIVGSYLELTTTAAFLTLGVWLGLFFTLWKTGRLEVIQ